jgi:hypothetical protein
VNVGLLLPLSYPYCAIHFSFLSSLPGFTRTAVVQDRQAEVISTASGSQEGFPMSQMISSDGAPQEDDVMRSSGSWLDASGQLRL